jgi:hypothetical protein
MVIYIALTLTLISTEALAQTKTVCLNAGVRFNPPEKFYNPKNVSYEGARSGFGIELMPNWRLSKKYSIGINLGYNLVLEDARTDAIGGFEFISYSPTFKHQLLDSKFSPFYSLGLGGYSVLYYSQRAVTPGLSLNLGTTLFRRCLLSFEYNKMLTKIKVDEDVINGFDNWYFVGIKLSFNIGIK